MMSNTLTWPSSLAHSSLSPTPQGLLASSPSSSASSTDSAKHPIRRVTHACDFCSYRKRRCDGEQPCANCVRRGRKCEYARPIYKRGPHHAAASEKDKNKKERRPSNSQNESASEDGEEDNEREEYKQKMKDHREDRERRRSPMTAMEYVLPQHQQALHLQHAGHAHTHPHAHAHGHAVAHESMAMVECEGRNGMEKDVALTLALSLPTWKYPNLRPTHGTAMPYSALVHHGKSNKSYHHTAPLPLNPSAAATSSTVSAALIPACSSTSALPLCTPASSKLPARLPLPLSPPSSSSSSSAFSPALAAVQLSTPTHFTVSGAVHSPAPSTPPPPSSVHTSPRQSPAGSTASSPAGVSPAQAHSPPPSAVLQPHTVSAVVAAAAAAVAPRATPTASPRKRRHAQLMAELRNCVVAADSQLGQKGAMMDIAGEKETIEAAIRCIQRLMHMKLARPQTLPAPTALTQSFVYPPASSTVMPMTAPSQMQTAVSLHSSAAAFPASSAQRFAAQMLGGYVHTGPAAVTLTSAATAAAAYSHSIPNHQAVLAQRQYVQPVSDEEWWSGSGSGSERGDGEDDDDADGEDGHQSHSHIHHHNRGNARHVNDEEETEDEKDDDDEELDRKKKQKLENINRHRSSTSMEMTMSECA